MKTKHRLRMREFRAAKRRLAVSSSFDQEGPVADMTLLPAAED